ncbi:MAG TPA: tetratricopeptide repeat protein, partial [Tepidisphaeraceae bacterium]|nr:tetratricopeptide repeat protein [Tepidisphaeraceae bacterium]
RDYQAALAIQPGREETRLAYCVLLRKLNRPQEAIENYEKALELNPDSVAVRSSLADMLARAGYLQEAMRYTAEAIELKPDPRLENNYGVMLIQTGHADEAAAQFSRAISTDPGFADAYDGLGFAREAQGRYSEAEALYRKAIELNPDFKIAQNHLSHLRGRIR